MTYCLNPDCSKPRNPDSAKVCRSCGATLRLKDRYRAIAPIGQGGFGRTFLAVDEDKPSKPRCVIKQFLPLLQNPQSVKKAASLFSQEAVRLEELGHHPQIPELLAYFSQEGSQYLIQEFIYGKNLAEVLLEQGPFVEAQIWEVLTHLLPVLDFVHSHKVIHRDIKPGNVISPTGKRVGMGLPRPGQPDWSLLQQALVLEAEQGFRNFVGPSYRFNELMGFSLSQPPGELAIAQTRRCQQLAIQFARYPASPPLQRQYLVADAQRLLAEIQQAAEAARGYRSLGRLALVDFGAAKSIKGVLSAQTGTTIGSPEYVAPEQSRGKAVFASDLYSLGVTCVHLLTQMSPYDLFDSATQTWQWRQHLKTAVSEPLAYVLERLLAAAIAQRYQSAAEVLQDVEGGPKPASVPSAALQVMPGPRVPVAAPVSPVPGPLRRSLSGPAAPQPVPVVGGPPSFRIVRYPPMAPPEPMPPVASEPVVAPEPPPPSRKRSRPDWYEVYSLEHPARIYAIAYNAASDLLVCSSGTGLKLWDLKMGQPLRSFTGHLDIIPAAGITPDGKWLISGSADKTIGLWDSQTGRRLSSLALHSDTVLALALAPSGQLLASSSFYDPITLWDLEENCKRHGLTGHTARVDALAFHPDGLLLASGSADLTIKFWDGATGELLRTLEGHTHQISALAFSPDGNTLASASWDGTVKLWSVRSRRQARTLAIASGRVNGLAFSHDGKKLAVASDTLQLWTLASGKHITLPGHPDGVCAVLYGADAQTLISAGYDRTVKLWRWGVE